MRRRCPGPSKVGSAALGRPVDQRSAAVAPASLDSENRDVARRQSVKREQCVRAVREQPYSRLLKWRIQHQWPWLRTDI